MIGSVERFIYVFVVAYLLGANLSFPRSFLKISHVIQSHSFLWPICHGKHYIIIAVYHSMLIEIHPGPVSWCNNLKQHDPLKSCFTQLSVSDKLRNPLS